MKNTLYKYLLKIILFIVIINFLYFPFTTYSGGTTHVISVTVPGFPAPKLATVYLPEGYDPNSSTTYRVVYFLHGVNNTHNSPNYNPIYGVFDQLIADYIIEPVILVRPDGSAPPYLGSFYTNSALYGPCEDWIYNYLVNYIDLNYKTKAGRNNRVILGHSMGGYGSMKMAFKHPELYRAAASLSAPLDLTISLGLVPILIAETKQSAPPYNFAPSNGLFSVYAFSMLGAFSPNLSNPPYYVNFMINPSGTINYPVFFQVKNHCAARLSLNISASSNLAVYFDCGYQDELGMLTFNNAFKDTLSVRNIPYHYENFNGTHWSKLFSERVPVAMHFLDSVMNYPEDALIALAAKIDGFNLEFGIASALKAKINSALNYWAIDDYNGVCSSMQDFVNLVKAQTGKKITEVQAVILLNDANNVRFALDCSSGEDFGVIENTSSTKFELFQNYPNPFNPFTVIKYKLPINSFVKLTLYDILGKEISVLVNEKQDAGSYEVQWNASNYPSGIYFYRLETGKVVQTNKMIFLK